MMRITIVGAGAIGGLAGGYMFERGVDVVLADVDRDHVRAINDRGLIIRGLKGEHVIKVPAVMMDELTGEAEAVAVAVKSQHTRDAVQTVAPLLGRKGFVVSLQNGFNECMIADIVGRGKTIGGLPDYGGALVAPGVLEHSSEAPLYLGELDGRKTDRLKEVANAFSCAVPVEVTTDIEARLWAKAVYGNQITLSAVVDRPLVEIMARKDYQYLAVLMVREGLDAAEAVGVNVSSGKYFDPELYRVKDRDGVVRVFEHIKRAGENLRAHQAERASDGYEYVKKSSGVWWDIVHKKRTSEVRWLSGELVQRAADAGVKMPLTRACCELVYEIEDGDRKLGLQNLRYLVQIADDLGYTLPGIDSGRL